MTPSSAAGEASRPLKVALALESDGPGGAEWTLIHLANGLRSRGHSVLPILPEKGVGWLGAQLESRGFPTRTFRLDHPLDAGCVLRLRRLFREEGVSVVHPHEFTLSVFATTAAALASVPAIVTLHSAQRFPERMRRRIAIRWAARQAFAATTVSEATKTEIVRRLGMRGEEWRVIVNGVPTPEGHRERVRQELGIQPDARLLLAVGNLYSVKGHDVLVRAMAAVARRENLPTWTLAVAGRGEEREGLERLARELEVDSKVVFLGFREDVGDLLHAADLFVHPSRSEGLPLAVIEAMSVGLPVVASDVGGIPEVVSDGVTGILVPPEDVDSLAAGIASLLADPARAEAIGETGRRAARDAYGIDRMVERYLELYRAALDAAR